MHPAKRTRDRKPLQWIDAQLYILVGGIIWVVFWALIGSLRLLLSNGWTARWALATLGFGSVLVVSVSAVVYYLRLPVRKDEDDEQQT